MSSVGQVVGGIVGGVIGFFVGGPTGALYGAQLGMMAGGIIDPPDGPVINGPRLDDLTVQTATYGAFIPRNYGTVAQTGNIFWLQGEKLIETQRVEESGGKGGPTTTTNTWEYSATFALGLCEGPIDGIRRIWINGQLWYDAGSNDVGGIIASNSVGSQFTLYTGTDTQLPDPLIQADKGAANVPAYRGLAYIVFDNLPLAKYNNSLAGAQVKVEIVKSGSITGFRPLSEYYEENPFGLSAVPASAFNYEEPYVYYVMPENDTRIGAGLVSVKTLNILYNSSRIFSKSVSVPDPSWGVGHGLSSSKYQFGSKDYEPGVVSHPFIWENPLSSFGKYYAIRDGEYYTIRGNGMMIACALVPSLPILRQYVSPIALDNSSANYQWACEATDGYIYFGVMNLALAPVVLKFERISGEFISAAYPPSTINGISAVSDAEIYYPIVNDLYLTTDFFTTSTLIGNHAGVSGTGIGSYGWMVIKVSDGVLVVTSDVTNGIRINVYQYSPTISSNLVTLSSIVQAECLQSSLLTAADLDATDLTDMVRGYRVSSLGALRGGIDPLRAAWPFDVVQNGYKIKFKRRGSASVVTINADELDARAAGENPGVQITNSREMDTLLPSKLLLKYIDATREYDTNEQPSDRGL